MYAIRSYYGIRYAELLRRPGVTAALIAGGDPAFSGTDPEVVFQAERIVKFDGYIRRQEEEAKKLRKYEEMRIPVHFSFEAVHGLSTEVRDKLVRVRPVSIGQARRIPGVTPAAVAILIVSLKKQQLRDRSAP